MGLSPLASRAACAVPKPNAPERGPSSHSVGMYPAAPPLGWGMGMALGRHPSSIILRRTDVSAGPLSVTSPCFARPYPTEATPAPITALARRWLAGRTAAVFELVNRLPSRP